MGEGKMCFRNLFSVEPEPETLNGIGGGYNVGWDNDDEESLGGRGGAFQCPYCWESVTPPLEADLEGELVWDCEVCCRPWLIRITVDYEGHQSVTVERAQN